MLSQTLRARYSRRSHIFRQAWSLAEEYPAPKPRCRSSRRRDTPYPAFRQQKSRHSIFSRAISIPSPPKKVTSENRFENESRTGRTARCFFLKQVFGDTLKYILAYIYCDVNIFVPSGTIAFALWDLFGNAPSPLLKTVVSAAFVLQKN